MQPRGSGVFQASRVPDPTGQHGQLIGWYLKPKKRFAERVVPLFFNIVGVVQGLMFILCTFSSGWQFQELKSNPLVGFSAEMLQKYGGTDTTAIRDNYQWWRIFSSLFVSAGLVQLWCALMLQWTFGSFLGRHLSLGPLACIYMVGGAGSVLVSANFASKTISTASTNPGMALMGAAIVELIYNRHRYRHQWITAVVISYVLGLMLFVGATPFVDNWGHVGALFLGALIGWSAIIVRSGEKPNAKEETIAVATAVAIAVAVVAILTASAAGIEAPVPAGHNCSWCESIVCANSVFWDCEAARIYPKNCAFNTFRNGTSSITCPKGDQHILSTNQTTQALLEELCTQYCNIKLPTSSSINGVGNTGNKSTLYK